MKAPTEALAQGAAIFSSSGTSRHSSCHYFSFKKGKKVNGGEDICKKDKYTSGVIPILS